MSVLQKELNAVDQQRHDPLNATNKEKQGELAIKREEILSKIIEVRSKLRADEAKLSADKWSEEQSRAKEAEQLEQGRAELRMSHIKAEQALIQSSPYLTDLEKAQQLLPWLKKENDEIAAQIALEEKRQRAANLKPETLLESQKKIEALKQQREQLVLTQQATEGKTQFGYQFQTQFAALASSFGTLQENLAKGWASMVGGMRNGLSTAFDDMMFKGEKFSQAMGQFGLSILHSMTQAFAGIAADWIMQHTVMAAWSSLFRTKETTETAVHTTAQVGIHAAGETAKTAATFFGSLGRKAIWLGETIYHGLQTGFRVVTHIAGEIAMTAASLVQSLARRIAAFLEAQPYIFLAAVKAASAVADIPFVGPVLAPIAAATTFAALEALAAFREGGYTGDGDPSEPAGIVHKGEFVIPAEIVRRMGKSNLQSAMSGRLANIQVPGVMQTPAAAVQRSRAAATNQIQVHIWGDRAKEMQDHIRSNPEVQHEVINLVGKNIHKFARR